MSVLSSAGDIVEEMSLIQRDRDDARTRILSSCLIERGRASLAWVERVSGRAGHVIGNFL
jgi:hypothetical protein